MSDTAERWPGQSWYEAEAGADRRPAVQGRLACRIAVIGAGLAGVSTALSLIERGCRDVVVVDAEGPGAGASGRNGGFVFAGYSLDNDALIKQLGAPAAAEMHGQTRAAVALIRRRILHYGIECQLNEAGVLLADWFDQPDALQRYAARMRDDLGFELDWLNPEQRQQWVRSPRYGGGLHEPGSFHFHPLRHIRGLAGVIERSGGRVFGQSAVSRIRRSGPGWRLDCPKGDIQAESVVLTTGGYDRRLHRRVQRALQPVATYIAVTEPLGERLKICLPRPVAVYDTRFAFDYYRPLPDSRLLWGGRISMAGRSPTAIRQMMRRDLGRVFPELAEVRLDYAWGGWMSYARGQMPLLGQSPDGLWYGLAFGGHGMATTTLAGEVLAEALLGERRRLEMFQRWSPRWAGGALGRLFGQGIYWQAQLKDALKDKLGKISNRRPNDL